MELISPEGVSLWQSKFPADSTGASGALQIPLDLPSGSYYLKGYTRWMRNFGPSCYAYLSIWVVNPYRKEMLPADSSNRKNPAGEWETRGSVNPVALTGMLETYPPRSGICIMPEIGPGTGTVSGSVSVSKPGISEEQYEPLPQAVPRTMNRFGHIPETRGASLSGRVVTAGSSKPVPYAVVYVTIMDGQRQFYCNYADSSGRFFFAFPSISGTKELFISASHPDNTPLEINVDHDFCMMPLSLPSLPMPLDERSLPLLRELAVNAQVLGQFESTPDGSGGSLVQTGSDSSRPEYFYGEPLSVVRFADFIKLPTMQEYFTELVPQVAIRRTGRIRTFRILGSHPDLNFHDPLVMVDGVAVFDHEAVLGISPRLVDRVEIVHVPYIKGALTFGGILHVITRERNLGYMDLPDSGLLIDYQMAAGGKEGVDITPLGSPREYDARNTLYWDPDFFLKEGSEGSIAFFTGDTRGSYRVLFRGYTENGNYFRQEWKFEVR